VLALSGNETDKIGGEFDADACDFCDRYKHRGLSRSSRLLLDLILGEGAKNKTVVDLGCGAGGFSVELLKKGAASIIGVDLSPKMVEAASKLALADGLEDRAKFQLANAATADLPSSDIVIMDKVLCCYSDWRPLLGNAIGAGRAMVGFIVPRDEGVAKWPFRLGVRVVNFFQKRRGKILFYLHPLDIIDRTLRDSGFSQRKKQGSRFWLVFLYSRLPATGT
jgi:SAM-dependent methyltransferase